MSEDSHCCLHTMHPSVSHSTIKFHTPIKQQHKYYYEDDIYHWEIKKPSSSVDNFIIFSDKYDAVFSIFFSWPCCFTSSMTVRCFNAWNDSDVAVTLPSNYMHLSESIGLAIVHIVSIKCVILFLVIGDISAYIQFLSADCIEHMTSVRPGSRGP